MRLPFRPRPTTSVAAEDGAVTAALPASVEVTPQYLRVGDGYTATMIVTGYPAEVGPAWLEPLLSWPGRLDVTLHIDPLPTPIAAARLKRQRARLESTRRTYAGRGQLDDPTTDAAAADAADLADRVARGVANLFRVGIYCTVHARTLAELTDACHQVRAAAASTLLDLQPATWRHLHGWTTTLPLGVDSLQTRRTMDTQALAAAFPLASPDLPAPLPGDPPTQGGVLYGVNPDSNGIIWWDRYTQDNYNSVVLARSGAGKSYFVKLETLRQLYQGIHVAIIDPEDEYRRLANTVGGTTISLGSPGVTINPLDLPAGDPRPDVLTRRALFLHTLIAVMTGEPPTPGERIALDRAILRTYRSAGITADPATHHRPAPLLRDLHITLTADNDPGARSLAARLTPWVSGSYGELFAGPTTHRPDGHLIVWSLRHVPDQVRSVATLMALDAIWGPIDGAGCDSPTRRRMVVIDEAWLLMRDGEGAKFLYRLAKAGRKRNTGVTVISQDAMDLLSTDLGQAVVANAATQVLLRQAPQAIDVIATTFGLTAGERSILLTASRGHGLLLAGTQRAAFLAVASDTEHRLAITDAASPVDLPRRHGDQRR